MKENLMYVFPSGGVIYEGNSLTDEEKLRAIVITERVDKEDIDGKQAILRWDVETQTAWYEYEDIVPTPEDEQTQRMNQFEQNLDNAILELTMLIALQGGM